MKFSKRLQFNQFPDWAGMYLDYSGLKKLIYVIDEKVSAGEELQELLSVEEQRISESSFTRALDCELERINSFYLEKERELTELVEGLLRDAEVLLTAESEGDTMELERVEFYKHSTEIYVLLRALKDYVDLNFTGFRKILKKHDKVTLSALKDTYLKVVESYPFKTSKKLDMFLDRLEDNFAKICFNGNRRAATAELSSLVREHIVWERNTVWQDMVREERKVDSVHREVPVDRRTVTIKIVALLAGLIAFAFLVTSSLFDTQAERNCLAILVFCAVLWAFEVIPLFATSLLVPALAVIMRVMRDADGNPLPTQNASKEVFSSMFSSVIMLLLGGFSIAAALTKHNLARMLATWLLHRAGTNPNMILLVNMLVATFLSMWISNVAAPVLCFSLIDPLIRHLPSTNGFARALVLGIALASNVGGMATPIASPQNAIAVANMSPDPSWLQWMGVTIPLCMVIDFVAWGFLILAYRPGDEIHNIHAVRHTPEPLNTKQTFILSVVVITVCLWCADTWIKPYIGDMGTLAILPMISFFSVGILTKEDFNSYLWHVVMLAMGGSALGHAVDSSGLLNTIAMSIEESVGNHGVWLVMVCFCLFILFAASFISHTVGAVVILPIVREVGDALGGHYTRHLVFASALMCSGAMALPISGFPNMTAISVESSTGAPYLDTKQFVKLGIPVSVIAMVLIVSLGYGMMLVVQL
eukprot:Rmarinus@m.13607